MELTTMDRRDFIKAGAAGTLALMAGDRLWAAEQKRKPNIIYILMDDAGYGDLGCYGQELFATPNIDRIAERGIKFTDHYAGSTVCAPSRCSLLTGYHTGHCEIRGNREFEPAGQKPLSAEALTTGETLKRAGYRTGAFGKWGLGYAGTDGDPQKQGFDEFFGYYCQRKAHDYYPGHLMQNGERIELDGKTYSHNLIVSRAIEFIRTNKDNPFFCYLPVTIPHASLHVPKEYVRPYEEKFKKYRHRIGIYAGKPVYNPPAHFAGMMTLLDEQVGAIMKLLEDIGIEDNTLLILASDNGPHKEGGHMPDLFDSNGPLRGYKRDLYEGGIRIPMVAMWPGTIKPGSTADHVSAFWDVMPTLCDAAGVDAPAGIDGLSFYPTLTGNPELQKEHEYLYWELPEKGGRQAVRKGPWKAVRYDLKREPRGDIELYNLDEDLAEKNNIAGRNPEITAMMKNIIDHARTESELFPLYG